jgi:hypothetical protein
MSRSGNQVSENGSDLQQIAKNQKQLLKFREVCRLGRQRARENKLQIDTSKAVVLQKQQELLSI